MDRRPVRQQAVASAAPFFLAATAVGLAVRIAAIILAPRYGYLYDHDDLVRWGLQANEQGLSSVYERPPPRGRLQKWMDGRWVLGERHQDSRCNYPPLAVYLLAASARAFEAASPDRLMNTTSSRLLFGGWSFIADCLLAAGCAAIVARFRPGRPAQWTYLLAFLAPPIWLVSCFWGQLDTWMLAPAVWMVYFMLAGKWPASGVLFGVVAAIKPQAVAFLPLWGLSLAIARPLRKPLAALALAGAILFVLALPCTIQSGMSWWRCSYQQNLLSHSRGYTTLMAFNPWYLDCLLTDSINENARWLGITKAHWGMTLTALALAGGSTLLVFRRRRDALVLLLWTVLSLLILVMLPTRVHERFLVLLVPFAITVAMIRPRFAPGTVCLVLACALQVTWPQWMQLGPPDWDEFVKNAQIEYQQRQLALPPSERAASVTFDEFIRPNREEYLSGRRFPVEWLATLLSLAASAGLVFPMLVPRDPSPSDQR